MAAPILFVSHTSVVSGAEEALLETLRALDRSVATVLACPPGELAGRARRDGLEVRAIRGTDVSLRLTPRHAVSGLRDVLLSAAALRRTARRLGAEIVHANTPRAGLIAALALVPAQRRRPALVVHVHDVLPASRAAAAISRVLSARADALVAVSAYVRTAFTAGRVGLAVPFPVLYNPIDLHRFAAIGRPAARAALGLAPAAPVVAVVAQITPWKGQDLAIRAFADVRRRHPEARLLLVGEPRFVARATRLDNRSYLDGLHGLARELELGDAVEFWGQRTDVPAILAAVDVILVPSSEEPLGRVMLEAMASGAAVIATSVGGPAEVLDDGTTGLLADPRDVAGWAAAIGELLEHPERRERMAERARRAVERFDSAAYAERLLDLYGSLGRLISRRPPAR